MKILIVDDNADDRRLLKYLVERKDHDAIEAGDGLEGLRLAKSHRPDLIISDALMPVMDGFQFLRQITGDETLKSIPFIFYSATYREAKDVDLALSLGAEAYIIKPKEPAELWKEVEIIFQNRKKEKIITPELITEDIEYLKRYSQVVAAKLEEKVRKLEEALAQQRKTEELLRQQHEFLIKIMDSLTHPFYVINADDYTVVMANSASHLAAFPGKNTCYALTHKRDTPCSSDEHPCPLKLAKETKKPVTVEHTHYDEAGNSRIYEVHGYPILDDDGNVVQMLEYLLDITESKQAERELSERVEELERFYDMAVGRELKMKELKREIAKLKNELAMYKKR